MHSTVRLAQTLAGFNIQELEHVLRVRSANPDTPHLTDLALQLLKPESITRALRGLSSIEVQALLDVSGLTQNVHAQPRDDERLSAARTRLGSLALIAAGDPLPEVTQALTTLIEEHGPLGDEPKASTEVAREVSTHWAHRAFLESQQAVLTLRYAREIPLKLTRAGTLSKAAEKLLIEDIHAKPEAVPFIIEALTTIEALAPDSGHLHATPLGEQWSRLDHAARWLVLCAGVLKTMPPELGDALRLSAPDMRAARDTILPALFPFLDAHMRERVRAFTELAEHFAITSDGVLTPPARALLDDAPRAFAAALSLAESAFPPVAPGVYVQPDLSVIAPGPVKPTVGLRLLDLADLTAPGLATSLVLSERSLSRALDRGWSADEIRSFLTEVSLTPIPQPLEYLLHDLAGRHGTIVVSPLNTPDGATVVRVRDASMAQELQADSRLTMLALTPIQGETNAFITRLAVDHVISLLTDARYPATRGEQVGLHPAHANMHEGPGSEDAQTLMTTIIRDRSADESWAADTARRLSATTTESGGLDIVPVLELAARTGQTLIVVVTDGRQEHRAELLPLSVSKGRLRALDQRAGLERTLAIRAITSVEPLHN